MPKYVPPSARLSAFNCPHCGVLTTQFWHELSADRRKDNQPPPLWTEERLADLLKSPQGKEMGEGTIAVIRLCATGQIELHRESMYRDFLVFNLHLSRCMECKRIAVWHSSSLLWPVASEAPDANPDLPASVALDYREAGTILNASPRGAAALLRLCVQKLCKELGEKGKNIDDDIASLVAKGLPVKVQRALDIVRVIGNEAVHPGQIDLSDDRPTAEELFRLVNIIAEVMISQPKHIDELYGNLPPNKLKAIEERDMKRLPLAIAAPDVEET